MRQRIQLLKPLKVTLFVQCLVDAIYPAVAHSMVTIFERLGMTIDCPTEQTCCGQAAFNAGYRDAAAVCARHFIDVFETADNIVCPSGSCVHMVRTCYPELFMNDAHWYYRAQRVAAKTYEFTEFLVDIVNIGQLGVKAQGRVTYHDSCHLRHYLGIAAQPRHLIDQVRGIEFVEMPDADRCCGFGGSFSVNYPEISAAMANDKVAQIVSTGANLVVGCDAGCLMNIQGILNRRRLDIKATHIAQFLAEGLPNIYT